MLLVLKFAGHGNNRISQLVVDFKKHTIQKHPWFKDKKKHKDLFLQLKI
jgi:hypothetical protein